MAYKREFTEYKSITISEIVISYRDRFDLMISLKANQNDRFRTSTSVCFTCVQPLPRGKYFNKPNQFF